MHNVNFRSYSVMKNTFIIKSFIKNYVIINFKVRIYIYIYYMRIQLLKISFRSNDKISISFLVRFSFTNPDNLRIKFFQSIKLIYSKKPIQLTNCQNNIINFGRHKNIIL